MKLRMTAVVLMLALAAWLPVVAAQQSTGSQPSAPAGSKAAGACCDHKGNAGDTSQSCCHGKEGAASCGHGKNGKEMVCCKEHAKGDQSAMNCCKGKDHKMCGKDGKNCCAGKDGKSCCGKDAVACNTIDGKPCGDPATGQCAGCVHG